MLAGVAAGVVLPRPPPNKEGFGVAWGACVPELPDAAAAPKRFDAGAVAGC